nr:TrkA C-terminal domain-containing protein [Methanocaldococcus fervens]
MTGLSKDVAAFQAQSAFTGAGFTTAESEYVVSHPVRRKIIRILILLGNAGISSAIATLVLTFVGSSKAEATSYLIILAISLGTLYIVFTSKRVERWMKKWIRYFLQRTFPQLRIYDYNQLLGIIHGYSISQIRVKKNSWLANRTLKDLELSKEGILVLGIYRKVKNEEKYIGSPRGDTLIKPGDVLVCYGQENALLNLSRRLKGKKGDKEHEKAVNEAELRRIEEEQVLYEG